MKSNWFIKLVCTLCLGAICQPSLTIAADQVKKVSKGDPVAQAPAPVIRVLAPNGGEKLTIGSDVSIKWQCVENAVYYNVYLTTDGGRTYSTIANELSTRDCATDWKVVAALSNQCAVRVEAKLDDERLIQDNSDAMFAIVASEDNTTIPKELNDSANDPSLGAPATKPNFDATAVVVAPILAMKTPNGGESYNANSKVEVAWTCEPLAAYYDVYWSYDGGKSYKSIAEKLSAGNCSYDWTTPSISSENCLVKVVAKSATNLVIETMSVSPFVIIAKPGKVPTPK